MDRRQLFTRILGVAAAATALGTLPLANAALAAPTPDAPKDVDRAVDGVPGQIERGAQEAEWAKKGGKGKGRGRGNAYGRRRKFGY